MLFVVLQFFLQEYRSRRMARFAVWVVAYETQQSPPMPPRAVLFCILEPD